MKNVEMLNNQQVVSNIPLVFEGRELSSKLQAKVMLMRVSYDKAASAFDEKTREALKGVKPEGFDDLAQEIERMKSIEAKEKAFKEWNGEGEKPAEPTKDELADAKKIREEKFEDYEAKEKIVLEKFMEIRKQEMDEECELKQKKFTEDEYAEIISVVKTEGEFEYKTNNGSFKIERMGFLAMIAANLVE